MRQQSSLVLTVIHAPTQLLYQYQQKEESLQEFTFSFSDLIQVITNCKPKSITDQLKICMYAQKLLNAPFSSKTIRYTHLTLNKAIDYAQNIERYFLLIGETQQRLT